MSMICTGLAAHTNKHLRGLTQPSSLLSPGTATTCFRPAFPPSTTDNGNLEADAVGSICSVPSSCIFGNEKADAARVQKTGKGPTDGKMRVMAGKQTGHIRRSNSMQYEMFRHHTTVKGFAVKMTRVGVRTSRVLQYTTPTDPHCLDCLCTAWMRDHVIMCRLVPLGFKNEKTSWFGKNAILSRIFFSSWTDDSRSK